jgi:hypothetical protein
MGFLPLGSGTKDQVLLITRKSYSSCVAIFHFFTSSPLNTFFTIFRKSYGGMLHFFNGHPPITSRSLCCLWGLFLCPSCCGSFKPSSYGVTNSSSEEEFDVDSSPSTSSVGLSFQDIQLASLTSSSSFTTSSTTTCFTCFKRGLLS